MGAGVRLDSIPKSNFSITVGAPIFKVPFPIVEPPAEVVAPEPEPEIKKHERPFWKDLKDTDPRHPNYINPEWIEAATKEFGVPLLPNGRCPSPDDDEYMPKGKSEYQLFKEREAERLRKLELMEYSDEEIVDDDVPVDPEPVSEFQMESSPISEKRVSRTPSVLRDEELNEPAAPEYQYTADELLGDLEEKVVTEEEDTSGDNGLLEDDLVAEESITVEEPILVEPETDSVIFPEEEAAMEYGILEKSDEAIKVKTPPKKTSKSVKKSVSVEQQSDPLDENALLDGAFEAQEEIDEAALLDKEISVEPENLVIPEEDSHALLLDDPSLVEPESTAPDFQYEDLEKEYGQPEKEATPAPAPTVVEPAPDAPRKRGRPKKRVPPQAAVGTVAKKPAPEKEEEPKEETKKPAAGRRARKPEEAPELVTGPRTKRTYVSANNPLPRVRDFVEPVAPADEEPDRLTGVAGACRAGSPGGTPEKLKHMSSAMRKLIEVDREESVVPQENVPIPVEEIKTEDQWVIPEPITPYSRQSKKRQREALNQNILEEIKEEIEGNNRENDCVIVFAQVGPPIVKIEDDPELVVMRANFNNEQLTQLEPEILPVKRIDPKGKEHPTHMWLITHKMWEGVNELFMTDPEKFSNLMMILVVDSKRRGNVFRYDVTVVNRTSEFTPAFINYLSECRKTLTIEQEESMEYNTFFKRYNEMATAFLGDHHISAYILHQVVENIKTVKNAIREDCPAGSLRENEREALATCERILIGQYIESIMKMAHISQVKWATNTHVKRRLEMIYHGWKMFLCTGGFFRLLLAIKMDKPISDVFRKYCQEYVEEIDILYARAIEIYKKTDEEVLKDMEETSGITAADIAKVDADIQVKKSETHTHRCSTCLIRSQDAYFSSSELLDIHEKIHTSDMEECGKCFSDLLVPELVMHRIITHYSMRVQDDY
ncbi:CRE-SDC-3 protein [Caenorhabditis remanei]|uniref:CRE-SDC-3 protein n=1 Tax=Caenorhabditis remanei TaxID=31234 RepID=E3NCJ6_CAERE|nr:CRE-SDC-3 protein [Caenorhabditis remanei]